MGILAVISKPTRRVIHVASEMGVGIQPADKLAAMSDSTFGHYRHGFKGLLAMLDGDYSKEDTTVVTALDFMRNAIIREKKRRRNANTADTE